MKRKTIIITLTSLTLVGLAVMKLASNKAKINQETSYHEVTENVPVHIQTASTSSLNTELNFVGSYLPSKEAPVSSEIAGKIVKIFVNEGDFVSEGQIIAELDQSLL